MQMSEDSLIVLGVDGGATKTACAAVLLSSRQHLNQASAGPSNWYAPISQPAELPCSKFNFHADLTVGAVMPLLAFLCASRAHSVTQEK